MSEKSNIALYDISWRYFHGMLLYLYCLLKKFSDHRINPIGKKTFFNMRYRYVIPFWNIPVFLEISEKMEGKE